MHASKTKIINQLRRRHGWRKSPYFVCEGLRCCKEAVTRRPGWIEFGVCTDEVTHLADDYASIDMQLISKEQFRELAQTETPQGILLVLKKPAQRPFALPAAPVVPILDGLADPGNVGTILRTCWAMGFDSVVWTQGTVHPLNPKAIRAGMGAQFAINLHRVDSLSDAAELAPDLPIWVTRPGARIRCMDDSFTANGFVVFGNEANGAGEVDGGLDLAIPMPGHAESLNVAQAATIVLYEVMRRHMT